jgi:hypothetical protein
MSTVNALDVYKVLAPVRLVASGNQSGTYYNGPLNNGVGATFTYATGALTIDSVATALNDYILLAGQTAAYQNGIYQVTQLGATGVSAILTRRGDFQCIEQIKGGSFVPVAAGTAWGGSVWTVIEPFPAAIGVPVTSGANNINFATVTAAGSSLYLQVANNLSDLNSVSSALSNLGLTATAAAGLGYVNIAMTLAQWNGMYAAPFQIVAAPGANKILRLASMVIYQTYGSAQLTAGGVVALQYGNSAHGAGPLASNSEQASDFTGAAANQNYFFIGTSGNGSNAADQTNAGLFLSNATQAFATGTGSSFQVHAWYYTVATP